MWSKFNTPRGTSASRGPLSPFGSTTNSDVCDKSDMSETGALMDHMLKDSGRSSKSKTPGHAKFFAKQDDKVTWMRDIGLYSIGTVVGMILFFCCHTLSMIGTGQVLPACPGAGLGNLEDNFNMSRMTIAGHRYAFVQIAYDPPGEPLSQIWQALAMARSLKRFSKYPLVVLTNTTQLPDGTTLTSSLSKLNAQMLPVHEVPLPPNMRWPSSDIRFKYGFWKLQIWRLTQFEKLVWLDTDAVVVRSVDWLFERQPTWGQRDSSDCEGDGKSGKICTAMLLVAPSEETYSSLMRFAGDNIDHVWERGDEDLIQAYFASAASVPIRALEPSEASHGKCLGQTPNIPYDSPGVWNSPAFVHKSALRNECFFPDITKQQVTKDGKRVNICTYHPLGTYWRDMFCDAVHILEVKTNTSEMFCDDFYWYRGKDAAAID